MAESYGQEMRRARARAWRREDERATALSSALVEYQKASAAVSGTTASGLPSSVAERREAAAIVYDAVSLYLGAADTSRSAEEAVANIWDSIR